MKRRGFLFEQIATFDNLLRAAKKALRGKKNKNPVAITIYEEEIFPESFAQTQHYLGVGHRQLALYEDRRKHQLLAIKCYRNALRVYTEEGFPFNHQVVKNNLDRDMRNE